MVGMPYGIAHVSCVCFQQEIYVLGGYKNTIMTYKQEKEEWEKYEEHLFQAVECVACALLVFPHSQFNW